MRKVLVALTVAAAFSAPAVAGVWESNCAGCHNGALAPSADALKSKLKTKQKFIEAAKNSPNPMMMGVKSNPQLIKQAADEIFK
ncbi:MAG: hypothetical protein DSY35_04505 [Desulfurobacterium sp.]|nr:MAG: hypothetical protein DSY35_04505 [Desulfurobacterium sp.]